MKHPVAVAAVLLAGMSSAALAADQVGTRVVILLDTSGSFAKQAPAAAEKLVQLLEDWSKQRVQRGNRTRDELRLIALDASPDVVYQATLGEIRKAGPGEWRSLIGARNGYAGCTDVGAGFRKAVDVFRATPLATANYLIVASDLIDEPIDPRSIGKGHFRCVSARFTPPAGMPWQDLVRLQVKGFVTWLPTNQSIIWKKALADNGLGDALRVFDGFESGVQSLPTPERPKPAPAAPIIGPNEVPDVVAGAAGAIGKLLLWGVLIGSLIIGGAAGVGAWRRRRQGSAPAVPAPMPSGTAPRPVTGPVAPLRLDRRMQA